VERLVSGAKNLPDIVIIPSHRMTRNGGLPGYSESFALHPCSWGREAMPVFDRESQEVYERAGQEAEITGFAWDVRAISTISASTMRPRGARSRCNRRLQKEMGRLLSRLTRKGPFTNKPCFGARGFADDVPVGQALPPLLGTSVTLDLNADGEIRQAPDGWHALLGCGVSNIGFG
jgi:hypothetical protein